MSNSNTNKSQTPPPRNSSSSSSQMFSIKITNSCDSSSSNINSTSTITNNGGGSNSSNTVVTNDSEWQQQLTEIPIISACEPSTTSLRSQPTPPPLPPLPPLPPPLPPLPPSSSSMVSVTTANTPPIQAASAINNKISKTSANSQSQASLKNTTSANNLLLNGVSSAASAMPYYTGQQVSIDETPTKLVYKRVEAILEKMQDEMSGVPIRTVKNFMAKIPSVCTGTDIIQWIMKKIDGIEDTCEALHYAHLISSHGYIFPIDDHILTVKNDGTFYRFQTPLYWPSNNAERDNTDYAVYLCKRTMQNKTRLELADYEAENLAKLQKLLSKKWEFIYMQAEAQIKVDKKRDKQERKILDSQERAFWDVYRPAPGCLNTTEEDIKKTMRMRRTDFPNIGFFRSRHNITNTTSCAAATNKLLSAASAAASGPSAATTPGTSANAAGFTLTPPSIATTTTSHNTANSMTTTTTTTTTTMLVSGVGASGVVSTLTNKLAENDEFITMENLRKEKDFLKRRLERRYVKTSKVSESYTNYFEQYIEFDPFITPPDPANPWISDSTELWETEKSLKDIPQRRVRRWGFSIHELLKDQCGRELFRRFLEREFSSENLRFYEVCNELRYSTNKGIANKVNNIYNEFLAPFASCPINIDSRVMAITKQKMENADRYTYDEAREHIFNLMTRDSYNRFLRSDAYKDSLASAKKKQKSVHPGRMSIVRPNLSNM